MTTRKIDLFFFFPEVTWLFRWLLKLNLVVVYIGTEMKLIEEEKIPKTLQFIFLIYIILENLFHFFLLISFSFKHKNSSWCISFRVNTKRIFILFILHSSFFIFRTSFVGSYISGFLNYVNMAYNSNKRKDNKHKKKNKKFLQFLDFRQKKTIQIHLNLWL